MHAFHSQTTGLRPVALHSHFQVPYIPFVQCTVSNGIPECQLVDIGLGYCQLGTRIENIEEHSLAVPAPQWQPDRGQHMHWIYIPDLLSLHARLVCLGSVPACTGQPFRYHLFKEQATVTAALGIPCIMTNR